MNEKPENFQITLRNGTYVVERNFDLPEGGSIAFKVNVSRIQGDNPSISELHQASADRVVKFLLQFLPENFGPYPAGQKEAPQAKKT